MRAETEGAAPAQAYVAGARRQICEAGVLGRCGRYPAAMRACVLALEHERMHQETLTYMLAQKVHPSVPRHVALLWV